MVGGHTVVLGFAWLRSMWCSNSARFWNILLQVEHMTALRRPWPCLRWLLSFAWFGRWKLVWCPRYSQEEQYCCALWNYGTISAKDTFYSSTEWYLRSGWLRKYFLQILHSNEWWLARIWLSRSEIASKGFLHRWQDRSGNRVGPRNLVWPEVHGLGVASLWQRECSGA